MMKKTALLVLLALSLVLSGCSLVVKDPQVDLGRTVLQVNGDVMTKREMLVAYNQQLNQEYQMQQFYQMYGMQAPQINPAEVLTRTKDEAIRALVLKQQAASAGLDVLSETEQQEFDKQVDSSWQMMLDQVKAQYLPETELTGEALDQELNRLAQDLGQSREGMASGMRDGFVADKLQQEVTKGVEVSDEEVKADFDTKVEADKAAWESNPDGYGSSRNSGGKLYYAPAGYRLVKQVLVKFLPEDQTVIDEQTDADKSAQEALSAAQTALDDNAKALEAEDLSDDSRQVLSDKAKELETALEDAKKQAEEAAAALQQAKDKGYEAIRQKAQDIYDSAATRPFDELVKEFNEDPGTPAEGYAIREGFATFDQAFVKPAMALQQVGDVAEASPGAYGYYIVQYAGDVQEGPVPLADVQESIHSSLLSAKKTETWNNQVNEWIAAAEVTEYMDRLED